jgi:hypothetical protein
MSGDTTAIMSISSTLIQACLSNIQKEFSQLEHWLNLLHPSVASPPIPSSGLESALRELSSKIDILSKQYDVQQLAINHIVDRLDILEGAQQIQDDPWLDSSDELENMVIEPVESVYVIRKEESDVVVEPIVEPIVEQILEPVHAVEPVAPVEKAHAVEPVQAVDAIEPVHAEEEEEEEDGVELSEITYKDTAYYKDSENFVYGIDDEGQPSDQPIGIWKEKTQSVSFYRLK